MFKKYHTLPSSLSHHMLPEPIKNPRAGHLNTALLCKHGLDTAFWSNHWVDIISGEKTPSSFKPLAMVYAGHQFGVWAGQLGDGRGLLIDQFENQDKLWDLHLKGAGKTPYSRMGDGRAVLRSTIREYLAGHALNALGVSASDAIGFVSSDTPVQRETLETAATLLRVADSHIRLGHFEWINAFQPELLEEFTDYVIQTYYPETLQQEQPVLSFALAVVCNTAKMIANWQLTGFSHGVMNTDNLSITGSTLDFGPYSFMQRFQPDLINNHSDNQGRYTYQNQPGIAHWNLSVWLSQLLPLQKNHPYVTKQSLALILDEFEPAFLHHYKAGMAKKLGLNNNEKTFSWSMQWLQLLQDEKLDYTNSFRALMAYHHKDNTQTATQPTKDEKFTSEIKSASNKERFNSLIETYLKLKKTASCNNPYKTMQANNPVYILRNEMVQRAIEQAEQGCFKEVDRLYQLLLNPYEVNPIEAEADTLAPEKNAPSLIISCSS